MFDLPIACERASWFFNVWRVIFGIFCVIMWTYIKGPWRAKDGKRAKNHFTSSDNGFGLRNRTKVLHRCNHRYDDQLELTTIQWFFSHTHSSEPSPTPNASIIERCFTLVNCHWHESKQGHSTALFPLWTQWKEIVRLEFVSWFVNLLTKFCIYMHGWITPFAHH